MVVAFLNSRSSRERTKKEKLKDEKLMIILIESLRDRFQAGTSWLPLLTNVNIHIIYSLKPASSILNRTMWKFKSTGVQSSVKYLVFLCSKRNWGLRLIKHLLMCQIPFQVYDIWYFSLLFLEVITAIVIIINIIIIFKGRDWMHRWNQATYL